MNPILERRARNACLRLRRRGREQLAKDTWMRWQLWCLGRVVATWKGVRRGA